MFVGAYVLATVTMVGMDSIVVAVGPTEFTLFAGYLMLRIVASMTAFNFVCYGLLIESDDVCVVGAAMLAFTGLGALLFCGSVYMVTSSLVFFIMYSWAFPGFKC
jgi:hypothetical protein